MARHVAFLRAINLAKHRKVSMAVLTTVLEDLGYEEVETFLNSGNVAFTSPKRGSALEREIEAALEAELGFEVPTFIRSSKELAALAAHDPFPDVKRRKDDQLHVTFLKKKPSPSMAKAVAALSNADDLLLVEGRELWHLRRGSLSETTIKGSDVEKTGLGPGTNRNITTVRRLAEKNPA